MKIEYNVYKEKAYKGTPQVAFDYFYRKISNPVSYIMLRLGLYPNHASVLSILSAIAGGIAVIYGSPVFGFVLFIISYLFDFCDGNMARVFDKTVGISEVSKTKGRLIENINTNISLLMMYISLSYYFFYNFDSPGFFLVGFLAFGTKMACRYLLLQSYPLFKDIYKSLPPGEHAMERFSQSIKVKIKFLFTKCFFSANFYYILYLASFIILGKRTAVFFIVYSVLDICFNIFRGMKIFFRKYN